MLSRLDANGIHTVKDLWAISKQKRSGFGVQLRADTGGQAFMATMNQNYPHGAGP